MPDKGMLKIQCFKGDDYIPLEGCKAIVTPTGRSSKKRSRNIILQTDSLGLTGTIELDAPPRKNSQTPDGKTPYSTYDIKIQREGFNDFIINGCQIYPDEIAYQKVNMTENKKNITTPETIIVLDNRLYGNFPPKIPEDELKKLPPPSSGVVLPKPVVPEYIVVHEGVPSSGGKNHKVLYKDYIKNVASSEIYSTWPKNTIEANVFCIISFTLNRIYTEWYRSKGYSFDITNSTAYDHAFSYGRTIYESISVVVDEIFSTYIKRIGRKQPLLTQYCSGTTVKCPQWLSQWGSKDLGDQGKTAFEILRYYYGNNIQLSTAEKVNGIPESYPGYSINIGASGAPVRTIQQFLNRISINYPLIPKVAVDGVYGSKVAEQVKVFQGIFGLPKTGVVDYATWYKISEIYVGVTKIAELNG
ncbi:peptidoglycan-binding protein [uncultured Clostridium sp.]|uniref:peptidoglycan-binding protein n=1 Tax=uncultured Clostridium sp. TaxID=59620 RepID=UPI002616009D|nr:peptidoglycan-binding protein [uncultured Clostridium sp.]